MSTVSPSSTDPDSHDTVATRADRLFQQYRDENFRQTDKLFVRLMLCQWAFAMFLAIWISPRTWSGPVSQVHIHVWLAFLLGGALTLVPIWATYAWPGKAIARHWVAVGQTLMSTLLIHLTGGRVETHFHIFGSLVILSFYRDWRVLIPATLVVGIDHFVRGIYWPASAYGVLSASPWRSLEHTGWVLFEDVFLVISCLRSVREMRAIAKRTAEAEHTGEELRLQTALLTAENEASIDGILVVSAELKILTYNRRFLEMWGMPLDLADSRDDISMLAAAVARVRDPEAFHARVQYLYENPDVQGRDEVILKDGRVFDRYSAPVKATDGTLYGRIWFFRDVSEEKLAASALLIAKEDAESAREESERANMAKSEFLSRMSHELRTPLNAILGFGQLLEMDELPESQSQSVKHILKGGRHLLGLINEVLDIARIESGKLDFSLEAIPVAELVGEVTDLVKPLAQARQIYLSVLSEEERSRRWRFIADLQRVKQVLLNLLSNAIKYNVDGGRVTLSCQHVPAATTPSAAASLAPHGRLRLAITDTGRGIASEDLARLFTPFERLDAESTNIEGSGIGLALSKRLIEAMGGQILVESVRGRGSTFTIDLPAAEPLPEKPLRPLTEAAAGPENDASAGVRPRRTILQIEDNLANRQVIEQLLERRGDVDLLAAMQGRLGLDLAREHRPDLVLLDLHLPDLPGAEVLARMRADDVLRHIPVIVISADATEHQQQRLLAMGARAYLTKPFEVGKLMQTLDDVLLS